MKRSLFLVVIFTFSTLVHAEVFEQAETSRIENNEIVRDVSSNLAKSNAKCAATVTEDEVAGSLLVRGVLKFKDNSSECQSIRAPVIATATTNYRNLQEVVNKLKKIDPSVIEQLKLDLERAPLY